MKPFQEFVNVLSLVDIHCQFVGIHCDAIAKVDSSFARFNFKTFSKFLLKDLLHVRIIGVM